MEPIWWGLHEALTRNHRWADMVTLLGYATCYLGERQPFHLTLGKDYQASQRPPP